MVAAFKSEWVAAFKSEYPAGFIGIRSESVGWIVRSVSGVTIAGDRLLFLATSRPCRDLLQRTDHRDFSSRHWETLPEERRRFAILNVRTTAADQGDPLMPRRKIATEPLDK
jgi:hypothetical protein